MVDLSGRGPGVYTLPLVVSLERFMEQVGGTKSITVEIIDEAAEETSAEGEETPPPSPSDEEAPEESGTPPPEVGETPGPTA